MTQFIEIFNQFEVPAGEVTVCPHGNGHINDTYLVTVTSGSVSQRYILQRMNHSVFPNPLQLMHNITAVTDHLRKNGNGRQLQVILTKTGESFYQAGGEGWRVYTFIENALSLEAPEGLEDCFQAAYAFGSFQRQLSTFPASDLYEVIPNFHNTPDRYFHFLEAVEKDACNRLNTALPETEFIRARCDFYSLLESRHENGRLPLRVTHNDTKLNNVLLDRNTRKPLCVIDLDTVMPGYAVNDFGDLVRFGANTAAEDEQNLDLVHFDLAAYRSFAEGFIQGCDGALTDDELELLPYAAKMMTIECGMRFLTDYLNGDTYFKTKYDTHNLVRCRTQLRLVAEMEEKWDEMCIAPH